MLQEDRTDDAPVEQLGPVRRARGHAPQQEATLWEQSVSERGPGHSGTKTTTTNEPARETQRDCLKREERGKEGAGNTAQVLQCKPGTVKTLGSIPSTAKPRHGGVSP